MFYERNVALLEKEKGEKERERNQRILREKRQISNVEHTVLTRENLVPNVKILIKLDVYLNRI